MARMDEVRDRQNRFGGEVAATEGIRRDISANPHHSAMPPSPESSAGSAGPADPDRERVVVDELIKRWVELCVADVLDDVDVSLSTSAWRLDELENIEARLGPESLRRANAGVNEILSQSSRYASGAPYRHSPLAELAAAPIAKLEPMTVEATEGEKDRYLRMVLSAPEAGADARLAERDGRLQIEHSHGRGEPLGVGAAPPEEAREENDRHVRMVLGTSEPAPETGVTEPQQQEQRRGRRL
jgi:hypothetical protein